MKDNGSRSPQNVLVSADSAGLVQKRSVPRVIIGMLCRFVIAFAGVAGICMMLDNAFALSGGGSGTSLLLSLIYCLLFFVLFTAANTNMIFFAVSVIAAFSAFGFELYRFGARELFVLAPVSAWNRIIYGLSSTGYTSLSGLIVHMHGTDPTSAPGLINARMAFALFCCAVSLVFVACTFKKVRAIPVIVTAGMVMTVTFTYNLLTDNFGFLLSVSSAFGILVLKYHAVFVKNTGGGKDGLHGFAARRKQLVRASVPGTAAFVAAAVVFSLCAAPAAYLKWPAPELTVFNDVMDRARDFLYGYISGEGPMNIDESADLPYKSAEPAPRKFRNKKILTVTASDWSSLYLRSWIGEEYSGDKWTASNAETEAGVDLVPEEITELFFTIVDNSFNQLTRTADMADERLGFVTELVTVKSDALGGDLALLPSRFSPSYGITVPGRLSEQYPGYSLRNGVGVAEMRMTGARYTVVSYAQNYKNISLYRINNYMTVYELVLPYVMEYISDRVDRGVLAEDETEKLAAMKEELAAKAEEAGVAIPYGCLINRIGALYDSELRELRQKLDDVKQYEDYVYGRCLSRPWRDITVLQDHALAIYGSETADASSMKPSDVYTYADKTARYLNSLCTYTLEPTGYTENGSVLSQFLTTAKNGYCVQYATAGAMLLRTIGIPTRFADGYLASNFTRQRSGDYRCTVLDTNAHAWIEVYVRNYGWMTFEMTGPMLGGIYSSSTPELIPETEPVSPQDDPETSFDPHSIETTNVPPHGETSGPDTGGPGGQGFGPGSEALKKTLLYVGIAVLCVAAVATVIYLYLKYVTDRKRKRSAWLKDAANGLSADPGKDTEKIKERIFFLFGLIGKERGKNELMSDFAERIDRELNGLKSFAPAAQALQKHSFGHCADKDDCAAAADYCSYLAVYVRSRLNRFKKFIYVDLRKLV